MEEHGELPPEIIDDILLRLPAKSLCRFKCVSKPWKALISDHDFVIKHINRATENKDVFLQRRRVIFTDSADKGLYTMDLDEFLKNHNHVGDIGDDYDEDEQVAATELDYIYREQPSVRVSFFHSCDGLILLELSNAELYLVNPATSESKHLPKPRQDRDLSANYNYHLYGFGFDSSTSQYQLVRGDIFVPDENLHRIGTVISVFNFEADSWRHIPGLSHGYFPASSQLHRNENGVLLHGRFHWLMAPFARVPGDEEYVILVFNPTMIDETREIQLPLELSGGSQLVKVGAFREWLCITFATEEPHDVETYTEFWVMKEYGVRESWTKMRVSIPYTELYHSGFWTESHDLMFSGERLLLYNFDEEDPQIRKLSVRETGRVGRVGVYIESLVSVRDLNIMRIQT